MHCMQMSSDKQIHVVPYPFTPNNHILTGKIESERYFVQTKTITQQVQIQTKQIPLIPTSHGTLSAITTETVKTRIGYQS